MVQSNHLGVVTPALDVRQRLQHRPPGEPEHNHFARGIRVEAVAVARDRMHYHRTTVGVTAPAPNRPGHRHQLRGGGWTEPAAERWSSVGVRRL